ncbi:MAG: hypothetical protein RLO50_07020 [Azospirillaceae bacterium]
MSEARSHPDGTGDSHDLEHDPSPTGRSDRPMIRRLATFGAVRLAALGWH